MKRREQAGLGSPGIDELRWLIPVYSGDTLRCESEVLEKRRSASKPDIGILKSRLTVFDQDDVAVVSKEPITTRPTAGAVACAAMGRVHGAA